MNRDYRPARRIPATTGCFRLHQKDPAPLPHPILDRPDVVIRWHHAPAFRSFGQYGFDQIDKPQV